MESFDVQRGGNRLNDFTFSPRQYGSTRTEEGITPSIGGSSRYLPLLPEERWYRRGVELMLWTKERIESMVKSFNRLPPR